MPTDSPFARVITALQTEVKTRHLANKTKQWFNETQGSGSDLHYRFTGKDSRCFCHNFMRLIRWLSNESDSRKEHQTLLLLAYLGVRLRDCVSLFNRFDITLDQISQLSVACCEYFNVNAMFMQSSVNPTCVLFGHWAILSLLIVLKYLKSMARVWEWLRWKDVKLNIYF